MAERGAAMESVVPEVKAPLVRVAEHQPEFVPVTVARVNNPGYPRGRLPNSVLLAFRPSTEERTRIAEGADIYVSLLTGDGPMQGVLVLAGKEDAAAVYNVPVDA